MATIVTTRRIGGAERPSVSEVARINPPKTWAVRGIDGPIRACGADSSGSTLSHANVAGATLDDGARPANRPRD